MGWRTVYGKFSFLDVFGDLHVLTEIRSHVGRRYWPNGQADWQQLKSLYERVVAADKEAAGKETNGA